MLPPWRHAVRSWEDIQPMNRNQLAALIDHTVLRPDATDDDIRRLCAEAREFGFHSVCINPRFVALAAAALAGSAVRVCTVVGFPLGATTTRTKCEETAEAVGSGASEIDMVAAIGALKAGQADTVRADIAAVKAACKGALLKVIIEACLLTDDEKVLACRLAAAAGADFVKTSTGFSKSGATVADVALMRRTVGSAMGVKAAGGISSRETALAMVAAGASRIGASAGPRLLAE
jgi:deoxyribose-phosphate aldolase